MYIKSIVAYFPISSFVIINIPRFSFLIQPQCCTKTTSMKNQMVRQKVPKYHQNQKEDSIQLSHRYRHYIVHKVPVSYIP